MFCFVLTSPPLMLCVYLQTFEAALFWKKKNTPRYDWEMLKAKDIGKRNRSCVDAGICQSAKQILKNF